MKSTITGILACPVCKNKLVLTVAEETDGEVESGSLHCRKCGINYNITGGIPQLLPPE